MLHYDKSPQEGKPHLGSVDKDARFDWVVGTIARRFGLSAATAKVVAFHAGLSSNDDRAPASGGRTK